MRSMTHFASFHPHGRMFKREWAALIDVALETSFFVSQSLIHQCRTRCHAPRRCKRAVRVVTITAGHKPFIDTVLKWHRKICSNIAVAPITKFRLGSGQQEFWAGRFVNGVALRANHVILRVSRAANVCTRERVDVASQACIKSLLRRQLREGHDGCPASMCLDMSASWTVAALATCVFRLFCSACNAFEVRIFVKVGPNIGMACFANHAADVSISGLLLPVPR